MLVFWFRASKLFRLFRSKTYTKRCKNSSLLLRDKKNFFPAWIYWSRTFDFRMCFGKTSVAFDFDEKLTKSAAQNYVISCFKRPFRLYFAVDQVLSISRQGRCPESKKYWIKNTAEKILTLISFRFCLLC